MLRTFNVFCADQVEGEFAERFQVNESEVVNDFVDFAPADELIEATGADIRHGGGQVLSTHHPTTTSKCHTSIDSTPQVRLLRISVA